MIKSIIFKTVMLVIFFSTAYKLQAHVALDYPQGGETFTAGETITIQWHIVIVHNTLNWDLFFSSDGGTSWDPIQTDIPAGQLSYEWEVPPIATTQGRVLVVMDNSGTDYQHSSLDFTITTANMPPNIDITAQDTTIECSSDNQETAIQNWLDNHGGASATGFCGAIIWTNDFTFLSDDCGLSGSASVTFTASDDCGSSSTTATLMIIDSTAPTIDTPSTDFMVECDGNGNINELNDWLNNNGGALAFDDCGSVSWTNDFLSLNNDCGATGNALVIFTATDECGNSSTTGATFTIEDTTPPVIDLPAQDITLECGQSNQTALIQDWLNSQGGASASDICGDVVWTNDFPVSPDTCDVTSSFMVTFTATDECGNSDISTASLTLEVPPPGIPKTLYINKGIMTTVDGTQFPALAFNSTPNFNAFNEIIHAAPGDTLYLMVVNNDDQAHNFQIKGMNLPNTPIAPGETATYLIGFPTKGFFNYFDDLTFENYYMGLAGMVVVDDFAGKHYFWNLREHESAKNIAIGNGEVVDFNNFNPDYFTINGKSHPQLQNDPLASVVGEVGDTLRVYIANSGLMSHSVHFHGFHLKIIHSSKHPEHLERIKDTFPIDRQETLIVEFVPDKAGLYPVHDHNLAAVMGGGEYPNGMLLMMNIE